MRTCLLHFSPPSLTDAEIGEVVDALQSDWITTGPKTRQFEGEFAGFVGSSGALALSSGTAALHLTLATLGLGPGDAVISTPMTFCSSIHVIEHVGARPVLVDVEPDTLNIDPAKIAEAIEERARGTGHGAEQHGRVRAILPVHLYGHPCAMDSVLDIAERHRLAVIEDAAHALPARFHGRMVGSAGDAGSPVPRLTAFSFYATKNLTTAEGGMLTGPPDLLDEARIWSLHGMSRDAWKRYSAEGSWFYEVIRPGFKYNLTDIQAAIGLQQLRRLPEMHRRRRWIFEQYDRAFRDQETLTIPTIRPGVDHAYHLYVLRLNLPTLTIDRARFIEEMRRRNIGTSVHFIPVHLHPYYRDKYGYRPDDFPVSYREYQRIVSLPVYPRMTDADVGDVIDAVLETVKAFRR